MSFYHSSSSSNYLSNSHLAYNYHHTPPTQQSSSSDYHDVYRSQVNLRSPYQLQYQPHFYVPPPSFMSLKKPYTSSSQTSETRSTLTIKKVNSKENVQTSKDDIVLPKKVEVPVKVEPTRSQSVSNLASHRKTEFSDTECSKERISPFRPSDSNDLAATAISNIQLNNTDDLMTQVDYFLNEVS